jgi:hypothetical protein
MDHVVVFIEPRPAVGGENDVPEIDDLLDLKTRVDMRDNFLDEGRRIVLCSVLSGGMLREKFVVDLDEIISMGVSNGLPKPITGVPPGNCCHDVSSNAVFGMAQTLR